MTDWPSVALLLLTYDRLEFAEITLRSALDNLRYSGRLSVHVADDGSAPEYRARLAEIAGGYPEVQGVSVTDSARGGYGANYNLATQAVHAHCGIILPLEDDWKLMRALDLDTLVSALGEGEFGCIRLGHINYTDALRGEFVLAAGRLWLLLDPDSPERHVFAGHPRLETMEWERRVGPWPEGLGPNQTEFAVCGRRESREGVAWPTDLLPPSGGLFVHIGAYQAGEGRDYPREAVEIA